jgi:hypothetical protein
MSSIYTPNHWVVLKLSHIGTVTYKVLAGWSGGYLDGDSWQMNSGIIKATFDGEYYEFHGYSGSVYRCHKNSYGLSSLTSGILTSFQRKITEANYSSNIEVVDENIDFTTIKYGE